MQVILKKKNQKTSSDCFMKNNLLARVQKIQFCKHCFFCLFVFVDSVTIFCGSSFAKELPHDIFFMITKLNLKYIVEI